MLRIYVAKETGMDTVEELNGTYFYGDFPICPAESFIFGSLSM
jgi:hypothetical protein